MANIINRLKSLKTSTVTKTQIRDSADDVFIENANRPDFSELSLVTHAQENLALYGRGVVHPDQGAINEQTGTTVTVKPDAGDIYRVIGASINAASASGTVTGAVGVTDGAGTVGLASFSVASGSVGIVALPYPVDITTELYLTATASESVPIAVGYQVVAMV